jgi:hypothetical protein
MTHLLRFYVVWTKNSKPFKGRKSGQGLNIHWKLENMRNYQVLYYPHFQPNVSWLKAMLLFVDGVVRIIPEDVDPKDSDALKTLINEIPGSLTSISPIPWDMK